MSDGGRRSGVRPLVVVALAIGFGALWGVAQGLWILAPILVDDHRIWPRTSGEWLTLLGALTGMCAVIAAAMSLATTPVMILWAGLRGRTYRRPEWVAALAPAGLVPLAYLLLTVMIEWGFAKGAVPIWAIAAIGAACIAVLLATQRLYEHIVARPVHVSPWRLVPPLCGAIVLALVVLPWRVGGRPSPTDSDERPLAPRTAQRRVPPLLFVGLDSGNWHAMRPMLERGRLPTFARLIASGVHGTVETLWPPYWSGPAWAAIVTGHPREETGVFVDLTVGAPGLPPFDAPLRTRAFFDPFLYVEWRLLRAGIVTLKHPPRAALGRTPIWEMLHRAGIDTGVVRFDFTDPPIDQGAIVVSSRLGRDVWRFAGVDVDEATAISAPPPLAAELLAIMSTKTPPDEEPYQRVLQTSERPPGAHGELEMDMLRTGIDIDRRTFAASRLIAQRRPRLEFLATYIGGFDGVCHAFWPYRFPEAYGDDAPEPHLIATFGGIIDRYLEYLDGELAALLAALPADANVMLVADHGHTASMDNPLWRGWHGEDATFIAAGPAFPPRVEHLRVSYFDVVPTILDVLGFEPPAGLHGSSIRSR